MTFFVFAIFAFSTLHDFSEKTYEKACCLYNIFSKYISNDTRLTRFTILLLFPKKFRLFQLNVRFFFTLNAICRKNYDNILCYIIVFNLINLQFPVSTIKHQEKHVAQCLLLEDIGTWKFTFFVFLFFAFSTLHDFSDKTYEKGCCLTRSTNSMTYFESSFHFAHVYIPWSCKIFCQKCSWSLQILTNYYLFVQLWALFVTKPIKTLTIFTTHSPLSYQILQKFQLFSNK